MVGRTISRYRVLKKLGEGGMSDVYLAQDVKLDRRVALKFLSPKIAENPAFRTRFLREARAAAAVDHPYVCKIYEVEEVEGTIFLVLEYVDGQTLQARLREGRIPIDDVLHLACEIAEALAEAHLNNVIHRDIKPGNIMLTRRGHVKVMDFGLAKQIIDLGDDQSTRFDELTRTSSIIGTPQYMSPEQARSDAADARSDIFALGIVLYEMAAGVHPFRRATPAGTMAALLYENHAPLNQVAPELPGGLAAILDRMLAKPLHARFPSMQQLWLELVQLQRGVSSRMSGQSSGLDLAVLPFTDLSPGKNQEYFCDGLVEELINALTQVEGLRVVSRTSVFRFKDHAADVRQIAAQLNVKAVLEGSLRKSGRRVRIMVKLVNGETGHPLWSERYESMLGGIFEIQDAITRTVIEKLKTTLTGPKRTLPASRPPVSIEVYDEYFRALYCWNKRTEDGLRQSVRHFENAITADPQFESAFAGLAVVHATLGLYGMLAPDVAMAKSQEASEKALALNADSALALTARGCMRAIYGWDWSGAERDFQAAIQVDPKYALAHHWYANNVLIPLARFDEARSEIGIAERIDPLSPPIALALGLASYFERRYLRAIEELRQAVRVDPSFGMVYYFLGHALVQAKQYSEAIEALAMARTLTNESPEILSALGYAHAMVERTAEAQSCLEKLIQQSKTRYISPVLMGQVCVGMNLFDDAISYLQQAQGIRSADLIWLNVRPAFDPIRTDSRFQKICSQMGLQSS